jgi:DNA-binding GntR family transcriptional regulator
MIIEPLTSLDRTTLSERALTALRRAITSGQYRPGDHLGEVALASDLGVSRGTVRQALRHLQQEGLVTAGRRAKLRVSTLSQVEVAELFRVRAALEGLAVRQIIASAGRTTAVANLRRALNQLDDIGADFTSQVDADMAFHLCLCQLSGNSMLVDAWRNLEGRTRIVIISAGPDRARPMMSRTRHEQIVDAIEQGVMSEAIAVVSEHMTTAAYDLAHSDSQ